jgi:hypothetical protein
MSLMNGPSADDLNLWMNLSRLETESQCTLAEDEQGGCERLVSACSGLQQLLLLVCDCRRHLSSLEETNTSASSGSTMLVRMDESTLLPPLLLGASQKLLVSPTRHSAILGGVGVGVGVGVAGAAGRRSLNFDVKAMMPVESRAESIEDRSACSRMMTVAEAASECPEALEQREALKMKGEGCTTCQRERAGGSCSKVGALHKDEDEK